ncbi:hypothetical protein EJB05_47143 [Eragrostis curvula]|uniref:Knottin scorpion toxin-like domain-containing protein n=1 Tax=Eragrostis curvula TaxID=38414 RepID=A0A5J9T6X7_9POAL|nr:hypothetical protein EJB05_50137 [Eragrostis curvula]TVU07102.1 hypothetical protein EJB05_47143 [Eragrostis curvula]
MCIRLSRGYHLSTPNKMNVKVATLCCLLLVLVVHADHTSAGSCGYTVIKVPFCKSWSCEAECWLEAKLTSSTVSQHKCTKGGIKGRCYCLFCQN